MAKILVFDDIRPAEGVVFSSSGFLAASRIRVFYDDVSTLFSVEYLIPGNRFGEVWYSATGANDERLAGVVMQDRTGLVSQAKTCVGGKQHEFRWQAAYPYVQKAATTNDCQPVPVVTKIVLGANVVPPSRPATFDGKIIFNVTAHRPIGIRLFAVGENGASTPPDAPNFGYDKSQSETTFENLAPGWYAWAASAYNPNNPAESIFNESPDPEGVWLLFVPGFSISQYGLFANGGFTSPKGHNWEVDIRKANFTGISRQFCMMDAGLELNYRGTNTDLLFSNIVGLSADITLKASSLRDWTVLYTTDDREYFVEIRKNGTVKFRGYLLPDLSSQPHTQSVHAATFTAADGLATLKDEPFTDDKGKRYAGRLSLDRIVTLCLSKCNLEFSVHWAVDWRGTSVAGIYPAERKTNDFDFWFVDVSIFYRIKADATCFDVLTMILQTFQARLSQNDGIFLIEQPYTSSASETMKAFYGKNRVLPNFTTEGDFLTLDRYSDSACSLVTADNIVIAGESVIEVYPATRGSETDEKLWPVLLDETNLANESEWRSNQPRRFPAHLLNRWVYGNGIVTDRFGQGYVGATGSRPWYREKTAERSDGVKMKVLHLGELRDRYGYETTWPYLEFTSRPIFHDRKMRLKFDLVFSQIKFPYPVYLYFIISWGGRWISGNGEQWLPYSDVLEYVFTENEFDKDIALSFYSPILEQPADGAAYPVRLRILQPIHLTQQLTGERDETRNNNSFAFRSFKIEAEIENQPLLGQDRRIFTNQGIYNSPVSNQEIVFGGWQKTMNSRNARTFYPGVTTFGNAEDALIVEEWKTEDGFSSNSMADLAHRVLVTARQTNRERLQAEIFGQFDFYKRLRLLVDNSLTYFCVALKYSTLTDRLSGEFVQVAGEFPRPQIMLMEDGAPIEMDGFAVDTNLYREGYTYDESFANN